MAINNMYPTDNNEKLILTLFNPFIITVSNFFNIFLFTNY